MKIRTMLIITIFLLILALLLIGFLYLVYRNQGFTMRNNYLSHKELVFLDSLSAACACEAAIWKDRQVEEEERDRGHVFVILHYPDSISNYCFSDSAALAQHARKIFLEFSKVLQKKESYLEAAVEYSSSIKSDLTEIPTCERTFYFDVASHSFLRYEETNREYRIRLSRL